MNPRARTEFEGMITGCFDSFVAMALDKTAIPSIADDQGYKTDRFVAATDDERRAALELYPEVQGHLVDSFRRYVEEERDFAFNEGLQYLDDDLKFEILCSFAVWYGTMSLRDFLSDKNGTFNPLYLTEWCDGLAVMCVQDVRLLRERILECLLQDLFLGMGMPSTDFLMLPLTMQLEFYKKNQELITAILQSIGNSLPDTEAAPAS